MSKLIVVEYDLLDTSEEKEFYRSCNKTYSDKESDFIYYKTGGHTFVQAKERADEFYGVYNSGLVCKICSLQLYFNCLLREVAYQIIDPWDNIPPQTIGAREGYKLPTCDEMVMKRALE